jgi:nitrite reductase/ring-hydroxylating ferredoxin subunit
MTQAILQWQTIAPPAEGEAVTFSFLQHFPEESGIAAHSYEGFIICHQGSLRAYRNSCPHAGSPMDWLPGQFFSKDGTQLVCHTHDARFDPTTGDCLSGPCPHGLERLPLRNIQTESVEVPAEVGSAQR